MSSSADTGFNSFYLSSFFIINILLIMVYPTLRLFTQAGLRSLKVEDSFGFTYENSIIYTVLIMVIMSYARSISLRAFFMESFSVIKVGITALLVFAQFQYSIIYGVVCLLLWMVVPYPKYSAQNKFIKIRNTQHFDSIVHHQENSKDRSTDEKLSKNHSRASKRFNLVVDEEESHLKSSFQYRDKEMFFLEFYADWTMPSLIVNHLQYRQGKEIWYSYSNKYTTEKLKFLQINVDKNPELAKRYKINATGFSKQLPSVVILEDGEEVQRFPPVDEKTNKVSKVVKLDYKILLKFFDLESRYLQTREIKSNSCNQNETKKEK